VRAGCDEARIKTCGLTRGRLVVLGHLSFGVRDLERAARFYDAVLAPLGYGRVWSNARAIGFGPPGGGDRLALFSRPDDASPPGPGFHLAFDAPNPDAVDAFHDAALKAGGEDAGGPGLRPHYGSSYYAAFVIDLDGYKLEAVHQ
jgi:catechol 2,3-dioxygenase-like lactoylglutathione lyase family enzyme